MMIFDIAVLTIFPFAMLVAASMDMFTMTIPNKISLVLIAGFFALAPFVGFGWEEFALHIGVAVVLLLIGMFMFAMGWIGGGDAKLFAATGLWLGYGSVMLDYALIASVLGGVLTYAILMLRTKLTSEWLLSFSWLKRLHNPNEGVPYGIALAIAGLIVYPQTIWMAGM